MKSTFGLLSGLHGAFGKLANGVPHKLGFAPRVVGSHFARVRILEERHGTAIGGKQPADRSVQENSGPSHMRFHILAQPVRVVGGNFRVLSAQGFRVVELQLTKLAIGLPPATAVKCITKR